MIGGLLLFLSMALQASPAFHDCDRAAFMIQQQERRDELSQKIRDVLSESQEISARRLLINQRLVELSEGRHRLKGVIDPNYNASHLRGMDRALASQLEVLRQRGEFYRREAQLIALDSEAFDLHCGTAK